MSFRAHAAAGAMLLLSVAAAGAETLAERMVGLLKDICISPATPAEMMAAGDSVAAASGWTLLKSGRGPMPMLHNEQGPEVSLFSGWNADLPDASGSLVFVSILGPGLPSMKWSVCLIRPSADVGREDLVAVMQREFGSLLTRVASKPGSDSELWVFNEDLKVGSCGRKVHFPLNQRTSRGQPKHLLFTDMASADDSPAARHIVNCEHG